MNFDSKHVYRGIVCYSTFASYPLDLESIKDSCLDDFIWSSSTNALIPESTKSYFRTNAMCFSFGFCTCRHLTSSFLVCLQLRKETTIQATGVASSLVKAIPGAGFRLQTLNLNFADEEEILV